MWICFHEKLKLWRKNFLPTQTRQNLVFTFLHPWKMAGSQISRQPQVGKTWLQLDCNFKKANFWNSLQQSSASESVCRFYLYWWVKLGETSSYFHVNDSFGIILSMAMRSECLKRGSNSFLLENASVSLWYFLCWVSPQTSSFHFCNSPKIGPFFTQCSKSFLWGLQFLSLEAPLSSNISKVRQF